MLTQTHVLPVAALCDLWANLHDDLDVVIGQAELHYLRTIALACDDDVVSGLLLRKLRRARIVADSSVPAGTVRMNATVEYRFGVEPPCAQRLVHASACPERELGIATSEGAALIGLRAGQAALWPARCGELHELRVLGVDGHKGLAPC